MDTRPILTKALPHYKKINDYNKTINHDANFKADSLLIVIKNKRLKRILIAIFAYNENGD